MDRPAKGPTSSKSLFAKKNFLLTTIISIFYLLLSKALIGFKVEQLILIFLFNTLYYLSFQTRKFICGFSVFLIYWIIFDYMKAFPNYLYNKVHIESLYNAERQLFSVQLNDTLLTPTEFWQRNTHTFLDIITGFFYLCWVPVPLMFAAYLFFKRRRKEFMSFSLTFLFVNLIGFVVYYVYPAAPPWYVENYGFKFLADTPGNTAGLHRFDDYFHIGLFNALYSQSSNVFAAMPSLHSAYPLITLYYGIKGKLGKVNILFAVITLGIWFSAVYTGHHYILDVLAGIACAVVGIFLFEKLIAPNTWFQRIFIDKFVND